MLQEDKSRSRSDALPTCRRDLIMIARSVLSQPEVDARTVPRDQNAQYDCAVEGESYPGEVGEGTVETPQALAKLGERLDP